jgi:hypothetical protein
MSFPFSPPPRYCSLLCSRSSAANTLPCHCRPPLSHLCAVQPGKKKCLNARYLLHRALARVASYWSWATEVPMLPSSSVSSTAAGHLPSTSGQAFTQQVSSTTREHFRPEETRRQPLVRNLTRAPVFYWTHHHCEQHRWPPPLPPPSKTPNWVPLLLG